MDPEVQRLIRAALDAHDEAFRALRGANDALVAAHADMGTAIGGMDTAIQGMSGAIRAVGGANAGMGTAMRGHDDAINAALAANRAAIGLLEYLSKNGH